MIIQDRHEDFCFGLWVSLIDASTRSVEGSIIKANLALNHIPRFVSKSLHSGLSFAVIITPTQSHFNLFTFSRCTEAALQRHIHHDLQNSSSDECLRLCPDTVGQQNAIEIVEEIGK
jgi:hypothetical protein